MRRGGLGRDRARARPRPAERRMLLTVARELRSRLQTELSADQLAYALLLRDGQLHPCTEGAEQAWEQARGTDPWRPHHLAILHHARAYDLEADTSDAAFYHWEQALTRWAELHRDDGFWARMHQQLVDHMGVPVDEGIVAAVRARLPRDLLAPHISLASSYRLTNRARSRAHIRLVTQCQFPGEVVADLREDLVREVLADVPRAVEEGRFAEMIDTLASWLEVDPTNPHVVRALLFVHRRSLEPLWNEPNREERIGGSVARVEEIARPALSEIGTPTDALSAEIARHEYWVGVVALWEAEAGFDPDASPSLLDLTLHRSEAAARQFELALRLDGAMELDHYYQDVKRLAANAAKLAAVAITARQHGELSLQSTAVRHLRRAADLYPADVETRMLLVQAILSSEDASARDVDDAVRLIEGAEANLDSTMREGIGHAVRELKRATHARKWHQQLESGRAPIGQLIREGLDADQLEQLALSRPQIVTALRRQQQRHPQDRDVLWALLQANQGSLKPQWNLPGGLEQICGSIHDLDEQVRPAIRRLHGVTGRLAESIARHEYWLGVAALQEVQERISPGAGPVRLREAIHWGEQAIQQFQLAVRLDPQILEDGYYADARKLEAQAEAATAMATRQRRRELRR